MEKKSFLEELRSLDENAKRKILIFSTIIIMIVVVYLWLGYFNGLVASVGSPEVATVNSGGAAATTGSNAGSAWQNIVNAWQGAGEYTVQSSTN